MHTATPSPRISSSHQLYSAPFHILVNRSCCCGEIGLPWGIVNWRCGCCWYYSCLHIALHNRFFKNLFGCVGSMTFLSRYPKRTLCPTLTRPHTYACTSPAAMLVIIGNQVVHSVKAAASEVSHLLWMPPLVAPSQDALMHTFWDAGCHSRDVSQCSTDYNMYLHQSTPCGRSSHACG